MYLIMSKQIDPQHRALAAKLVTELRETGKLQDDVFEYLSGRYTLEAPGRNKLSEKTKKIMNDGELRSEKEKQNDRRNKGKQDRAKPSMADAQPMTSASGHAAGKQDKSSYGTLYGSKRAVGSEVESHYNPKLHASPEAEAHF